jgi:inorganic phosphate transporter, PiT family
MTLSLSLLILAAAWLAYSNGANDNFKGVATLYGCGTASYRRALAWATLTTLSGSLLSVVLAGRLMKIFSGNGLVPEHLLASPAFLSTVAIAAAAAIYLATLLGMPTSTTHALAGALLGIAWSSASLGSPWPAFLQLFAAPLLISPVLAIALTSVGYTLLHTGRQKLGITRDSCLCLRSGEAVTAPAGMGLAAAASPATDLPQFRVGKTHECREHYGGEVLGIEAQRTVDMTHYLSGGAVCFSRALNDTPKIAALLLAAGTLSPHAGVTLVTVAVVIGGLLQSKGVAETMSRRITDLNPGQGLTANLVTAGLVLFASRWGLPVSTTHVSCGSIVGIGLVQGRARWKTVGAVLLTWVTTLPLAAIFSAGIFALWR